MPVILAKLDTSGGGKPGPAKINSKASMRDRVQTMLSAFATRTGLLMPACLGAFLSKEIFLPHGGERTGRQENKPRLERLLNGMLRLLQRVCLSP